MMMEAWIISGGNQEGDGVKVQMMEGPGHLFLNKEVGYLY